MIEFNAALEGEDAGRALLTGLRAELVERLEAGRIDWLGDDYELSAADIAQMMKHFEPEKAHIMLYGLAPGVDGWIDDNIAFTRPWGFDVRDIRVPVVLTHGRTDVLVPAAHGDWLAAHIPVAEAWVEEEAGHIGATTTTSSGTRPGSPSGTLSLERPVVRLSVWIISRTTIDQPRATDQPMTSLPSSGEGRPRPGDPGRSGVAAELKPISSGPSSCNGRCD